MWIALFFLAGLIALFGYGAWMRRGTSGLSARGLDPAQAARLGYRGPRPTGSGAVPRIQAAQLDCRTGPGE
ncbi:MAG TPA: hypothetical protein VH298_06230 [Jatrophihabitans sp.]|nr:hypothetical protein [Jatrophihabitans sp.]